MSSARTVGFFPEPQSLGPALTAVELEVPALDLVVQWHRCSLTADYLAAYLSYSFEHHETAVSVLSTAANELVENAAKFCADKRLKVSFAARHRGEEVELVTRSHAEPRHAEALAEVLEQLGEHTAEALFARRVQSPTRGGLGLIILAKDYGARLGPPDEEGLIPITLRAAILAKEVEQR